MISVPTFHGPTCDGLSRRHFLQVGALGVGAATLSLADVLRADETNGRSNKSVIHITLGGGPPHQDTFDLKPDAPAEFRGEFRPIATNVNAIRICEHLPRLARLMDRATIIRSIVGAEARHDTFQCLTGWRFDDLQNLGGRPCVGSVVSRLQGNDTAPAAVGLNHIGTWRRPGFGGFLGHAHIPFVPVGPGLANMRPGRIPLAQLRERRELQAAFDTLRRDLDTHNVMDSMDEFGRRAMSVLTSSRFAQALDLSREPDHVRRRYGDGMPYGRFILDGSPTANENFLLARRLVEAGVRVVTVPYGRWDSHLDNFENMRDHLPKLDQALSALIEDLDVRGMLDDVLVIAWGEFGRTPRINKDVGRDHWPDVNCAFLAGGGLRHGQVIGATTRNAEAVRDRPVEFPDVLATLYRHLGIDVTRTSLTDPTGRPQAIVAGSPIRELW